MLVFNYTSGSGVVIQDNTQVMVLLQSVQTTNGFQPFEITTPVVDVSEPQPILVVVRPENRHGVTIEWRCADTRFSEDASLPAWQSGEPTAGRYWQARVTVTDPFVVVDRIEFIPYSDRLFQQSMSASF